MAQNIQWTFRIQVQGGPSITTADTLSTEAYEKIQVTVEAGDADKVVNISADASLLIAVASQYTDSDPTHKLSYKINNAGAAIDFTTALVLIGEQVVSTFAAGLTSLSFTNTLDSDVVVDILTATDPTP